MDRQQVAVEGLLVFKRPGLEERGLRDRVRRGEETENSEEEEITAPKPMVEQHLLR